MKEGRGEQVSERFARLLEAHRRPDGSAWGGQELETATGGAVTRSYVSNLKNGRIGDPGLSKLGAIAGAMGFSPALWFGGESEAEAGAADPGDDTLRAILDEAAAMGVRDRRLLLGIARQISTDPDG